MTKVSGTISPPVYMQGPWPGRCHEIRGRNPNVKPEAPTVDQTVGTSPKEGAIVKLDGNHIKRELSKTAKTRKK